MSRAVVPGSFDPFTNGHLALVKSAAERYESVIAAIGKNAQKTPFLPTDVRLSLMRQALSEAGLSHVEVRAFDGLLADFAAAVGATVLVKGYRNDADYAYETEMAQINRRLSGGKLETVLLPCIPALAEVSSTLVRERLAAGESVKSLVPPAVAVYFENKKYNDKQGENK